MRSKNLTVFVVSRTIWKHFRNECKSVYSPKPSDQLLEENLTSENDHLAIETRAGVIIKCSDEWGKTLKFVSIIILEKNISS